MPRPLRTEFAGAVHHVWARGAVKQTIFIDESDHQRYVSLLARVVRWMSWRCLSWCLMGNHVHLLIETPVPNLGKGMQRLHGTYGYAFNKRHSKAGHVFGARYGGNLIENELELWVIASYIANNPVKAGLCAMPQDWRWSSHRAIFEGASPPELDAPRLLSYFAPLGGDPRERYLQYVAADAKARIKGLTL